MWTNLLNFLNAMQKCEKERKGNDPLTSSSSSFIPFILFNVDILY